MTWLVAAVRKYGRQSWRPWLLSFLVDYLSNKLSTLQSKRNVDEAEELARRKMAWFLYLIRSPFYDNILWYDLYFFPTRLFILL
jgi:hypothetical protein